MSRYVAFLLVLRVMQGELMNVDEGCRTPIDRTEGCNHMEVIVLFFTHCRELMGSEITV